MYLMFKRVWLGISKLFPQAKAEYLPEFDFTLLHVGDFTIEVVQADEKVSEGKKGTVLYWQVDDFDLAFVNIGHSTRGKTVSRANVNRW
ncbi:hypothetical protein [Providencia hangzhouensis]|uniref:hypothetical protein n=1 Tax=Providencia hangzhouensis TaxID=3031799 RepID=UPI0034DCC79E